VWKNPTGTANAPITWVFEPESFAPLAKLTTTERFGIVTDHLGTPTAMLDEQGKHVWGADIGVYGDLRNVVGEKAACPFRWPGQYEDEETGLYYNRFRYYDPEAGGYVSQDPIRLMGGLGLHRYVADSLSNTDPFGLSCNAQDELKDLGELKGKSKTEIQQILAQRGYSAVPAHSGGEVWTMHLPDGTTAAVRLDPAMVRTPPKGYADEVPHAHKEVVPTSSVVNGNYQAASTKLDDHGNPATAPNQVHIPIVW
jgi:RHS repeat-associated protein